ncbi:hypothetical protein VTO42DRAFT_129 [Malbranchea cinnamomea]
MKAAAKAVSTYYYSRLPLEIMLEIMEHLQVRELFIVLDEGLIPTRYVRTRHAEKRDPDGNTLLHIVAKEEAHRRWHLQIVNRYRDSDLQKNSRGSTPLHLAIRHRRFALAIALVNAGANVHARDKYLFSPIIYAAKYNNVPLMRRLIEEGANVNDVRCKRGPPFTPLYYAALHSNVAAARLLLDNGADPNQECVDTYPLHAASRYASPRLVKLLLERGADIELWTWWGIRTPLQDAVIYNNRSTALALIDANADVNVESVYFTVIFDALAPPKMLASAFARHIASLDVKLAPRVLMDVLPVDVDDPVDEVLERLIQAGAKRHDIINRDTNPLHFAVARGSRRTVEILLANGMWSRVREQNSTGLSPLALAIRNGYMDLAEMMTDLSKLPTATAIGRHHAGKRGDLEFKKRDKIRYIVRQPQ